MSEKLLVDKFQRPVKDIETLRSETDQRTGPDIIGLIKGLHDRIDGMEISLGKIQDELAIIGNIDPEKKRVMLLLDDFFKEIGSNFNTESLEIILDQTRNNIRYGPQSNQEKEALKMDSIQTENILDVRGLSCPMPTLLSIKAIRKIDVGEILQVDSDDPGCRKTLPNWSRREGHIFLGVKESSDYRSYFLRKG